MWSFLSTHKTPLSCLGERKTSTLGDTTHVTGKMLLFNYGGITASYGRVKYGLRIVCLRVVINTVVLVLCGGQKDCKTVGCHGEKILIVLLTGGR